jgi:poly(A) polymerase
LFYNIRDFSVIDWVGGLKDLEKKVIRSIGDPMIRFREDPVRMMRAIKFASRLDFKIEKETSKAMLKLHSMILSASAPRVCEEVFRLFPYGKSEQAFRMMWEYGLLGDLLPELSEFITKDGGRKSRAWKYLAMLDRYEKAMSKQGYEVPNGLRAAVLYAAWVSDEPTKSREIMGTMLRSLKIPKATYFLSVLMLDSIRRLSGAPERTKRRFIYNRDFPDALDFNRIVVRAEGRSEKVLDQWQNLYNEEMSKKHEQR